MGPFEVLGIEPTLDVAKVKAAYFQALARHPPHQDPEGFKRVRAAYEELLQPEALRAAFVAAPLDVEGLLRKYRERFDAAIARAGERVKSQDASAMSVARVMEHLGRLSWAELKAWWASRSQAREAGRPTGGDST